MLYTQEDRTFNGIRTRTISAAEFMNISSWPIAAMMRNYLNNWGVFFENDSEFIKMLNSKNDKQHYSAIFELLIATMLMKSGFKLEKHPTMRTLKKPDFKASHFELPELFFECTLSGNSFENLDEKNRKETIEEIIEGIEYYPYFINVAINVISESSISKKKLLRFISEVKDRIPIGSSSEQKYPFEDSGWKLEFSFINKSTETIKRSLGIVSGEAKIIDSSKPVLNALNDKRPSRYGISSSPYVICLSTNDMFADENSYSEALFGQYGIDIDLSRHYDNGLLLANKKPVNTNISAVIIARNLDVFTLNNSTISIWHNPFAANPIKKGILPFVEYEYIQNATTLERQISSEAEDIFDLLEIDKKEYEALATQIKSE